MADLSVLETGTDVAETVSANQEIALATEAIDTLQTTLFHDHAAYSSPAGIQIAPIVQGSRSRVHLPRLA